MQRSFSVCLGMLVLALGACTAGGDKLAPASKPATNTADCVYKNCGPTSGAFFDESKVAELRITLDSDDISKAAADARASGYTQALDTWLDVLWGKWKHCGPYDNYIPVQLEYRSPDGIGNVTLQNVGMRLRGTKSKGSNWLQGFKLDTETLLTSADGTKKKRKFAELSKLNELSIEGDKSILLQCAAYKLMRSAGVPAPRCNHLSVYVNGAYYGLMENVEGVDTGTFLSDEFDDDNGSLYSCSGGCGYDDSLANLEYLGDSVDAYQPPASKLKYELEQGDDNAPAIDLIPMLKCASPEQTPSDADYEACIQEWIDVPEWLRLIAAESLTPTLESFLGAYRNFYLYFTPDANAPHGGRFSIYSWDLDVAFQKQACQPASCDPFVSVAGWYIPPGVRSRFVLRLQKVFFNQLCGAMNDFLEHAYEPALLDGIEAPMAAIMNDATLHSDYWPMRVPTPCPADGPMPAGAVVADDGSCTYRSPLPAADWQAGVQTLRDFITTNRKKMSSLVAARCAVSSAGGGAGGAGNESDDTAGRSSGGAGAK